MQKYLPELMACPICHQDLIWTISESDENRILEATVNCSACAGQFSVREGIGIFLTDHIARNDTWAQVESGLSKYLKNNPKLEQALMGAAIENLSPADKFFRAMMLEESNDFLNGRIIAKQALEEIYTTDYLDSQQSQRDYLVQQIRNSPAPIIDIACGRGYLIEAMLESGIQQVVGTDFSPVVLRRNRAYFEHHGLYDNLSLIACDARMMPFKSKGIVTMTTYLGLSNIEHPADILKELARIVSGKFYAVAEFYPDIADENALQIRDNGLEQLMFENRVQDNLKQAGWQVSIENRQPVRIEPTPKSDLFGIGIDGLPVINTTITSCVLMAQIE